MVKELMLEMLDVREATIGAQVVNKEAFIRLEAERKKLVPLAAMHALHGEERACAVFDWMFNAGLLPDFIPDDVSSMVPQLRFGNGKKADRALFHVSGRLTIVEVKDACDPRAIVAGLGQALWYAAIAEREYPNSPIVPVLAVLGGADPDIARACVRGGVEYLPLGSIEDLTLMSRIAAVAVYCGRP